MIDIMYTHWPWLVLCLWLHLQESLFQSTQHLQVNTNLINYAQSHAILNSTLHMHATTLILIFTGTIVIIIL